MSQDAPAIPLFGDAYLADTRHLSLEEHGAYLQLMMIAWRMPGCALPDDDARIARMIGVTAGRWQKLKPAVLAFWTLTNDGWKQKRLSKERAFVEEKSRKNKSAAQARWNSQVTENIESDECGRSSERNAPPPPPLKEAKAKPASTPPSEPVPSPRSEPTELEQRCRSLAELINLTRPIAETDRAQMRAWLSEGFHFDFHIVEGAKGVVRREEAKGGAVRSFKYLDGGIREYRAEWLAERQRLGATA